jgi:Ran GTPase-activating protein (RanGAP) involved in mRNA processing and transport
MSSIAVNLYHDVYQNNTSWLCHDLTDDQAMMLAVDVEKNLKLEVLAIILISELENGLSVIGGASILKMIETHTNIKTLKLDGNYRMGDTIASIIAEVLKINTTLTSLSLKNCGLTDMGATIIAGGLKHNSVLNKLVINDNNITLQGWIQIRSAAVQRSISLNMPNR